MFNNVYKNFCNESAIFCLWFISSFLNLLDERFKEKFSGFCQKDFVQAVSERIFVVFTYVNFCNGSAMFSLYFFNKFYFGLKVYITSLKFIKVY